MEDYLHCANPTCSDRRVKVPAGFDPAHGKVYCSIECACYDKALKVRVDEPPTNQYTEEGRSKGE